MRTILAWILISFLLLTPALAQEEAEIALEMQRFELMDNLVRYPRLTGFADSAAEEKVNRQILAGLRVEDYLNRVAMLISSPVKLTADSSVFFTPQVFSAVMSAQGAVVNNRSTHVWTASNIDLATGEIITLDDLFTDPSAARAAIGEYLDFSVAPELSARLSAGALTPIPETFTLSPTGLTLYYPIDQLATLSDRAGAVSIHFSEIREHLNLSEGSVLDRLGAQEHIALTQDSRAKLTEAFTAGLPGDIPLTLGESVQALTDTHGLLIDPDLFEGGRMFRLEGAAYRGVYVLTDALTEQWDTSVVQGVRADRFSFYGLCTGVTTREQWQAALGAPETSLMVDAGRAEQWRIVPGTSDYYTFGSCRLRLHADEEGVLRSVFLTE